MKKLLTIALLLTVVLTAGAQGKWTVSHREADPMKNQTAKDVYIYTTAGGSEVVVWDWDEADFRLITGRGFFRVLYAGGRRIVPIRAGLYDENGNLEKMYDLQLVPEDNTNNKWIATSDYYLLGRSSIRKVMKRLKSGKGYVRFLGELYNNEYFDINVKPFQSE